jgi:hypothetical protein
MTNTIRPSKHISFLRMWTQIMEFHLTQYFDQLISNEQGPWKANSSSASREISSHFIEPQFLYSIHENPLDPLIIKNVLNWTEPIFEHIDLSHSSSQEHNVILRGTKVHFLLTKSPRSYPELYYCSTQPHFVSWLTFWTLFRSLFPSGIRIKIVYPIYYPDQ